MSSNTLQQSKIRMVIFALTLVGLMFSSTMVQPASADEPTLDKDQATDPAVELEMQTIVSNDGQEISVNTLEELTATTSNDLRRNANAVDLVEESYLGPQASIDAQIDRANDELVLPKEAFIVPEEDRDLPPILPPGDEIDEIEENGAAQRTVIGSDGRRQVYNTRAWPHRAIVYLAVTWNNGTRGSCTGWLIGPRTVATAGHCVYSRSAGGWARSIMAYPGRNGYSAPYGRSSGSQWFSVSGWTRNENPNYDYGAIKLQSSLGNRTGWFGFTALSYWSLRNLNVQLAGYPSDKPDATMWQMGDRIKKIWWMRLFYPIDTYGGQSGAPVYYNRSSSCRACSVAIHTQGNGVYRQYNGGTRITTGVYNNLRHWKTR